MKRIYKELDDLHSTSEQVGGWLDSTIPTKFGNRVGNWFIVHCWVKPKENTCYQDGIFQIDFYIPDSYPFKPPVIKFVTKVYHYHVHQDGTLYPCSMEITEPSKWSAPITMKKILLAIRDELLDDRKSVPTKPCCVVDNMWKQRVENIEAFRRSAREYTRRFADPSYTLLKKINDHRKYPLLDIRFVKTLFVNIREAKVWGFANVVLVCVK